MDYSEETCDVILPNYCNHDYNNRQRGVQWRCVFVASIMRNFVLIGMRGAKWVFLFVFKWKERKRLEMCFLLHPQRRFQPSSILEEETMEVFLVRPQPRLRNM